MNVKERLLVIWILVVVAVGFLFHHFLSWTVCAFQKAVAFSLIPLPGLVKFAAGICCLKSVALSMFLTATGERQLF